MYYFGLSRWQWWLADFMMSALLWAGIIRLVTWMLGR
jgi:hypothetical protein